MPNEYDVVIIGSGTGGYVAAIRAAQLGLKTAVVERAPVLGGTCLNWGCIPTKALLEHAHALKVAQDWKEWGLTIGQAAIGIDMNQVQARKDKIVKGLTGGIDRVRRSFVLATDFADTPFRQFYDRAKAKGWKTHTVACGHDAMLAEPREIARILLEAAG